MTFKELGSEGEQVDGILEFGQSSWALNVLMLLWQFSFLFTPLFVLRTMQLLLMLGLLC